MQKRFCSCGYQVFVSYTSRKGTWSPVLIVKDRKVVKARGTALCCPNCGLSLHINVLR